MNKELRKNFGIAVIESRQVEPGVTVELYKDETSLKACDGELLTGIADKSAIFCVRTVFEGVVPQKASSDDNGFVPTPINGIEYNITGATEQIARVAFDALTR